VFARLTGASLGLESVYCLSFVADRRTEEARPATCQGIRKVVMPKQILLVDDSPMVRRMVRSTVEAKTDWEICGEAENGEIAVRMVEELSPDLVVLDLSMPIMNGLEAARLIAVAAPDTALLMYTMQDSGQLLKEARAAGINEVISKSAAGVDRLIATMRALLFQPAGKVARV
jgi:DNA-binding NarL/FixJ family response regulator